MLRIHQSVLKLKTTYSLQEEQIEAVKQKFIKYSQISIRDIYKVDSFYKLCAQAGVITEKDEILDNAMKTAFPKFAIITMYFFILFC